MAERKKIVVGAWKAYLNAASAQKLAKQIADWRNLQSTKKDDCELVLSPSFLHLIPVINAVNGTNIELSGQDVDLGSYGAYTGHITPEMLDDVGCTYVILGHSELRKYKGESDKLIHEKAKAALTQSKLKIILCIGESLEEKNQNKTIKILESQLAETLEDLPSDLVKDRLGIAYEPVWAISSENPVSPPDASSVNEIHGSIRHVLNNILGEPTTDTVRILYGGSVNEDNVRGYLRQDNVDGILVGSASTKHPQFVNLLKAVEEGLN